jgi:tripartite-type tricarboxylate transporter receptor subunit TctC
MRSIVAFIVMLLATPAGLAADAYPSRPVRIIVAFAPGGASDINARIIANHLTAQLRQQFVVENRPGGGGMVANQLVANAPPDGYTLFLADVSFTIAPGLRREMPYDTIKDFTAISELSAMPNVLVVHPSLKVNTIADFITLVRENPDRILYGTAGVGTPGNLTGALFNLATKGSMKHVPYKGGGDLVPALLGGQIQMVSPPLPAVLQFVKSKQLQALVVTDSKRSQFLPDVPSAVEAGLPEMMVMAWYGLIGPRGLSPEIVNKLHDEISKAMADPAVRQQFLAQGAEPIGSTPQAFAELIEKEVKRWAEVIRASGIPKIE